MPDVVMPRLSDSMEEGTILKWLKSAGDEVTKGDELVEIETDKATMTYEADADGTLEIVAEEGSTLAIGEVIAKIGEGASSESESESESGSGGEAEAEQQAAAGGEGEGDGGGASTATAERTEDEAEDGGEDADGGGDEPQAEEDEEEPEASEEEEPEEQEPEDEGEREEQPQAEGEEQPEASSEDDSGDDGAEPKAQAADEGSPDAEGNGGRPKASPVARRIAREHGIDLAALEGSGPGGRIVKADVEAAASGGASEAEAGGAEAQPEPETGKAEVAEAEEEPQAEAEEQPAEQAEEPEAAEEEKEAAPAETGTAKGDLSTQEPSRIQGLIARRMAESKATIPHFTLSMDVDMEGAVELRAQLKEISEARGTATPSYNDMVVKACAIALRDYPLANASYRDGRFELHSRVNIGVAVAGDDTLVVPTIFDADHKGLAQIADESRGLAEKVRDGKISPPELSGGTFSITNLGMYGVSSFTAVINPPQSAILAVGKLEPKAVVRDGEVVVRATMNITISCDHRILSGAPAAEFLGRIKEILEQPLSLAL